MGGLGRRFLSSRCQEEFPPSGHELRLPEEPEQHEDDEEGQDGDLVEVHGPEIRVMLLENDPHLVGPVAAGTRFLFFVRVISGSGIFLPEMIPNFPDGDPDVKHLEPDPADGEVEQHWKNCVGHPAKTKFF